jgi:hypothetical protein
VPFLPHLRRVRDAPHAPPGPSAPVATRHDGLLKALLPRLLLIESCKQISHLSSRNQPETFHHATIGECACEKDAGPIPRSVGLLVLLTPKFTFGFVKERFDRFCERVAERGRAGKMHGHRRPPPPPPPPAHTRTYARTRMHARTHTSNHTRQKRPQCLCPPAGESGGRAKRGEFEQNPWRLKLAGFCAT